MRRSRFFALVLPIAAALLGPAVGPARADDPKSGAAKPQGKKLRGTSPAVSEAEARKFAETLQDAVARASVEDANRLFDWATLTDRATDVPNAQPQQRQAFAQGVAGSLSGANGLFAEVIRQAGAGGSYTLIRPHLVDGKMRVLFRMTTASGLNFHDIVVEKVAGGAVKGVDIYVFLTGELLTQTLRWAYLPIAASQNRGMLDRLMGTESDYVRSISLIQTVSSAKAKGQPKEALDAFEKLPPSLKKQKNLLVLRLLAAQAVGDKEYARAIEDIRRLFPDDPSVNLILIDGYIMKQDYPAAMAGVDRLDKALGGDPYLDTTRANIQLAAGDLKKARDSAQKAVKNCPNFIDPYWSLVTVTLKQKDFKETLRLLRLIDKTFQVRFGDLTQVPDYAPFVASPQYGEWKKEHPAPSGSNPPNP